METILLKLEQTAQGNLSDMPLLHFIHLRSATEFPVCLLQKSLLISRETLPPPPKKDPCHANAPRVSIPQRLTDGTYMKAN